MDDSRVVDAIHAEKALQDLLYEQQEDRRERDRQEGALSDSAGRRLHDHVRAALPDYRLQVSSRYTTVELHGEPGTLLSISFCNSPHVPLTWEDLEDFPSCNNPITISRYGNGFPEVGELINRFYDTYLPLQPIPASGHFVKLPGVEALDELLGRFRYHFDPRLAEMKKARRIYRVNLWINALFQVGLRIGLLVLGAYTLSIIWKILKDWAFGT